MIDLYEGLVNKELIMSILRVILKTMKPDWNFEKGINAAIEWHINNLQ